MVFANADRETFVSVATLAAAIGRSEKTVRRALGRLYEANLVGYLCAPRTDATKKGRALSECRRVGGARGEEGARVRENAGAARGFRRNFTLTAPRCAHWNRRTDLGFNVRRRYSIALSSKIGESPR